ncbi:MAG: type II secretion system protein [Verrucomicrobiae bacterium]|nr:type II secretion system protein [Verrucomicrobiae bacterium]MCP5540510.1 type II secretion system protein [Akkermansiaceae bacterium]MCP5550774.1 type II secretion system protein [Akkermansiaceae bacterium]
MKVQFKNRQAGLTLIEVTLVIAVLLGLISVLFIGVAAYKQGSDRAKCILNIATVQKAARSYQNLYDLRYDEAGTNTDALAIGDIAGSGKMIETTPDCPDPAGDYDFETEVPAPGTAFATCTLETDKDHVPANTDGW